MSNMGMAMAAPNVVIVNINDKQNLQGKFYHRYAREPVFFETGFQMLKEIDSLCDAVDYPQRTVALRSFQKPKAHQRKTHKEMLNIMSKEDLKSVSGGEGTFMVHVQYRQNATWQGSITWLEKDKTQSFRSALELMHLIESAINEEHDASK